MNKAAMHLGIAPTQHPLRRRELPLPGLRASLGLDRLLAALEELKMLQGTATPGPVLMIQFSSGHLGEYQKMARTLRAEGIGVNVHYIPVPWHPYYQRLGYGKGHWPVAENEYARLLSLPIFPGMTARDVDDVIVAVGKVVGWFRR